MFGVMRSATLFVAVTVCGVLLLGADGSATKEKKNKQPKADAEWVDLFDGASLNGWTAEGDAQWAVEEGLLVGRQGAGGAPGDLFTAAEYADFALEVEYRVAWPANSGIWFRYQAPEKSYQADILEYKDPIAYSGTLYCPGKMFLAVNDDPKLEKRDDWNTMKIRAKGERLQIWLNGEQTADVQDASYANGRIGFQIHAGDEFNDMKIEVRKVRLRPLK